MWHVAPPLRAGPCFVVLPWWCCWMAMVALWRHAAWLLQGDNQAMRQIAPSPLAGEGWGEGATLRHHFIGVVILRGQTRAKCAEPPEGWLGVPQSTVRHPCEGRDPAPRWLVFAVSPDRAFPLEGCLRGARFDRLPTLESLFFCWPKRKVTQRKWPFRALVASCWIQALELEVIGTGQSIRQAVRLHRNAP
jgi:hypothetical protein